MADTPRVTVPVEPTPDLSNEQIQSVMLEAVREVRATVTDHAEAAAMDADIARMERGPVDMGSTGWEVMRAVHRRLAMISAAPAPEGGAVCGNDWLNRMAQSGDAALATREEAPAEARPWKRCEKCGAGPAGNCGYYDCETPRNTCPIVAPEEAGGIDLYDDKVQAGISWTMRQWGETLGLKTWTQGDGSESVYGDVGAEIHTILVDAGLRDPETNEMAALRAQPQAREDAQPVAWQYRHPDGQWGDMGADRISVGATPAVNAPLSFEQRPLYTHPAPDALRVAVEALGVITDLSVNLRQGGPDSSDLNDLSDALNTAVDVAYEALAALQAEQKGGAA